MNNEVNDNEIINEPSHENNPATDHYEDEVNLVAENHHESETNLVTENHHENEIGSIEPTEVMCNCDACRKQNQKIMMNKGEHAGRHHDGMHLNRAIPSEKRVPKGHIKFKTGIAILVLALVANSLFTWQLFNDNGPRKPNRGLWSSGSTMDPDLSRISESYRYIMENYYTDVDQEKLIDGAIKGMMESLGDPFSEYFSTDDSKDFTESISGSFEGIGAEITQKDNQIVVVSPIKGSPAEKAGIKANDIIVSVDGESLEGKTSAEAVSLIKGEKGTVVKLVIQRPSEAEPRTLEITRDKISMQTVRSEMLDDKIAHISLSTFSLNSAKDFNEHLKDMEAEGMKGLVLDVRGNPGGVLEIAKDIANQFVPNGEIIAQIEDKDGKKEVLKANRNGGYKVTVPIIVLIDPGSASASEVLAAALQESYGAVIVGERSFGKGTMQSPKTIDSQSQMKLTVGKWLTPKGNWVHEKGITPDIEVTAPNYANIIMINPETKLEKGTKSAEVESAKEILSALGFYSGKINSDFDNAMETSVKAFQKANDLKETGIIIEETTTKLLEEMHNLILDNDTQLEVAVAEMKKLLK